MKKLYNLLFAYFLLMTFVTNAQNTFNTTYDTPHDIYQVIETNDGYELYGSLQDESLNISTDLNGTQTSSSITTNLAGEVPLGGGLSVITEVNNDVLELELFENGLLLYAGSYSLPSEYTNATPKVDINRNYNGEFFIRVWENTNLATEKSILVIKTDTNGDELWRNTDAIYSSNANSIAYPNAGNLLLTSTGGAVFSYFNKTSTSSIPYIRIIYIGADGITNWINGGNLVSTGNIAGYQEFANGNIGIVEEILPGTSAPTSVRFRSVALDGTVECNGFIGAESRVELVGSNLDKTELLVFGRFNHFSGYAVNYLGRINQNCEFEFIKKYYPIDNTLHASFLAESENGGYNIAGLRDDKSWFMHTDPDGNYEGIALNMNCPDDISIQIPSGSTTVSASWDLPTLGFDCYWGDPVLNQVAGPLLGDELTEGVYTIIYEMINDCYTPETCSFELTVIGGDSEPCDISTEVQNGELTIYGLQSDFNTKVFDASYTVIWECNPWSGAFCESLETVSDLAQGTLYFVSIQGPFCDQWIPVVIENCVDNDNDGVCAIDDCDDNDPIFPLPVGTPCNDFDPTTIVDVIQADGCTCLGVVGECSIDVEVLNYSCNPPILSYTIVATATNGGNSFGTFITTDSYGNNGYSTFPYGEAVSISQYVGFESGPFLFGIFDPTVGSSCLAQFELDCIPSSGLIVDCPDDINVAFPPPNTPNYGFCYSFVPAPEPTATSDCPGEITVTQTGGPGFSYLCGAVGTGTNGTFTYEISDECGNVETCSYTINSSIAQPFLELDGCSSDIVVNIEGEGSSAFVNFVTPSLTTNCDGEFIELTQTEGPSSGSILEAGTYTVTYEGTHPCYTPVFGPVICSFEITVEGDTDPCAITVESQNGVLTISGLNSGFNTKIFDTDFNVVWECNPWGGGICSSTETVTGLTVGATYYVSVQSSDCEEWIPIVIEGGGCTDNDNDGYCDYEDCDDNDANFPQPVGTACDDNDPTTINDMILSDGCTCAGMVDVLCNINVSSFNNAIEITGLTAQENTKVFDADYNVVWECNSWSSNPCLSFEQIPNLVEGATYFVSAVSNDCDLWMPISIFSGIPDNNLIATNNVKETGNVKVKNLFPNPTFGTLNVHLVSKEVEETFIQIFDLNGKVVFEQNIAIQKGINTYQFDLTILQAGMYQLLIHSEKQMIKERFVKTRN